MQSKLHAIAQKYVKEVGDHLQHYTFVFPNRRAGLFFRKYIAQYVDKPMFAPHVLSINECFAELSDLRVADQLTLLLRLYREYKLLHHDAEGLDRFLYWGKMMLADFSEIDNHLVSHVEALFASVRDLHALDQRFNYLSDNQRQALASFWKEFHESNMRHPDGKLNHQFLRTWDLLYPLYTALHDNLLQDGLAHEGMLHREVLAHWDAIPTERFREQYVFLGFNALTRSERELMLRLQEMGKADFYFDYDSPYLHDPENKASLFMEENLRLFRSRFSLSDSSTSSLDVESTNIHLISIPSTVGEIHEIHRILSESISFDDNNLMRTAVVLPDEQLLIPLLNAFPENVSKINVTMGYPLRATSLFMPIAFPEQFLQPMPKNAEDFVLQIRTYIQSQNNKENTEAIYQISKVLDHLATALNEYPEIAFTVSDMQQLLKMLTIESTIPYKGEPLDGLQVMGVLETRALDFDNIIIADFNDDLYPGRSHSNSFIPYTLRLGFDMPTPDRQNAIFAYNFYRMISYAKNVWLLSNSASDEQRSGEVSCYFYQLRWQYNKDIKQTTVAYLLNSNLVSPECLPIIKDARVQQLKKFSASSLTDYIDCPKKFYYKHIEHIKQAEIDESVSTADVTLGNVLHEIMQNLYAPFLGKILTASILEDLQHQVQDDVFWKNLSPLKALNGDLLAECIVRTYVSSILNYDYAHTPFQLLHVELPIKVNYTSEISIEGKVDRVDLKANQVRVIDYKTGSKNLNYKSMKDVFGVVDTIDGSYSIRSSSVGHILQTLLYCWALHKQYSGIAPYVYSVRRISDTSSITCIHLDKSDESVVFNEEIKRQFECEMTNLIEEIRNPEIAFYPATNEDPCKYCSYIELCGRQLKK